MRLLVILGSRNPEGRTARAANALAQGARDTGWETEHVYLPVLQIERCRQCDLEGWGQCRAEGRCMIEDDLHDLVDSMRTADAVAFATPVYYGDLSESMRAFTDRLRRAAEHRHGRATLAGKRAIGICVAGGGGGGGPSCAVSLEWVLRGCGMDVVDMVPARKQNLDLKCDVLYITGKWLAEG